MHPALIYYKPLNADQLFHKSVCIISDDEDHDVGFVYEVQKIICKEIIPRLSTTCISHITYYSDGYAGQYKNYKNFMNLCLHEIDFGLTADWVFFATSHGKSPCDGIGGTVKRLVRRESLHRPIDNQIINQQMFFNFCMVNIPGIIFKFLSSRMINQSRQNLLPRHAQGRTIPGTHSYHFYHVISANQIGCKYICSDLNFSATFDFSPAKYKKVKSMDFVACWYNFHWWVGLVLSVNEPQLEGDVKFMYPHRPSPSFFWPEQDDT